VKDLPDAREAHWPIEMPADHRQARRAAVVHISLENVRESSQTGALFVLASVGSGETPSAGKTNVNLSRADILFGKHRLGADVDAG
jgi:hypothetical protein